MIASTVEASEIFKWAEHYMIPVILPVLLVMDLLMLRFAKREQRERKKHISALEKHIIEVRENTELLSRRDYEQTILREIQTADDRIYLYWHSLHRGDTSDTYQKINQELINAKNRGVKVTLMVAAETSRIEPAYELVQGDVRVLFKESLRVSDLRFSLFDEKMTVFGMPEPAVRDGKKPSRHGIDIDSYKVNALLADYFQTELADTTSDFYDFVASSCCEVLKDPKNPLAMVQEQLGISDGTIKRACPDHFAVETAEDEQ